MPILTNADRRKVAMVRRFAQVNNLDEYSRYVDAVVYLDENLERSMSTIAVGGPSVRTALGRAQRYLHHVRDGLQNMVDDEDVEDFCDQVLEPSYADFTTNALTFIKDTLEENDLMHMLKPAVARNGYEIRVDGRCMVARCQRTHQGYSGLCRDHDRQILGLFAERGWIWE